MLRSELVTETRGGSFGAPDSRRVSNTLQPAEKYGTRLPALLTVPMMVFIMPVLFIVLLGPALLTAFKVILHPS